MIIVQLSRGSSSFTVGTSTVMGGCGPKALTWNQITFPMFPHPQLNIRGSRGHKNALRTFALSTLLINFSLSSPSDVKLKSTKKKKTFWILWNSISTYFLNQGFFFFFFFLFSPPWVLGVYGFTLEQNSWTTDTHKSDSMQHRHINSYKLNCTEALSYWGRFKKTSFSPPLALALFTLHAFGWNMGGKIIESIVIY